jgi:hypothetical protein
MTRSVERVVGRRKEKRMNAGRTTRGRSIRALATVLFAAVGILFSGAAASQSYAYTNQTVDTVGVVSWGTYGAFVSFVEGIPFGGAGQVPYGCNNGIAVFDQTLNNSKYWYMTFLTAKASGLHVWVDITQDVYRNCFIAGARIKT